MPFTPVIISDSVANLSDSSSRIPYLENQLETYTSAVTGVKGIFLAPNPANNTWISAGLILCFLLVTIAYRSSPKQIMQLIGTLFKTKSRSSYIQKTNVGLVRLKLVLLMQTFLLEGTALFIIFRERLSFQLPEVGTMPLIAFFAGSCMVFFLLQFLTYQLLGYLFAYRSYASMWTNSFTSITALRGLLLFLPVLIAIYHSIALNSFIFIICCVYFITRIIFIYKGLKIFFSGFYSLVYLILYLCTLEIAPLFVIYKGLFQVFSFVELKLV